jgi:S-adenosylmethionine decarboxylase
MDNFVERDRPPTCAETVGSADPAKSGQRPPARVAQVVFDLYGCRGDLSSHDPIEEAVRKGCDAVGATVVRVVHHCYVPHGLTLVAILLESHVVISTWPEHRFASVEIFLCNPSMDPRLVGRPIVDVLRPTRRRTFRMVHVIDRLPANRRRKAISRRNRCQEDQDRT